MFQVKDSLQAKVASFCALS